MKKIISKIAKKLMAIIYIRVSSDEQVDGTSLEFQEEACRKYCEQKGIEVVAIFKDEGESAKDLSSKNRKEFLRALEFCRKNKIDAFVVLRVSRFARNTEDHFAVRKILSKYGTALHSVTEPIGNKPSEKFIETVLAGAADYDNAIRRQQSIDGMCQKIKQGISPWKPPVGYICNHNKKQGQKKTEPDQIHPQVFPILQKVLRQYSKQLITEKGITIELAKTDFEKLTGIKPTKQFVHQLFGTRLTFYAGWLTNPWPAEDDSDKLIKGKHLAMITENEWELIKQTKKGGIRNGIKKSRDNSNFPLRRFVLCPVCKHPLTAST